MKSLIFMSFAVTCSRHLILSFSNSLNVRRVAFNRKIFLRSVSVNKSSRISRGDISGLDARSVSENLDMILSHLVSRRESDDTKKSAIHIVSLNENRVSLIKQRDKALQERKMLSKQIGMLMRDKNQKQEKREEDLKEIKIKSNEASKTAEKAEEQLLELEEKISSLLASLPNLLDDIVPDGDDESDNEEVETWGDVSDLKCQLDWPKDFEPKWHDDVAAGLKGWNATQAVGMSGSRFVAVSGPIAKLERAISNLLLDIAVSSGYTEVSVPYIVSRSALEGTSQLPKFENDLFRIHPDSHKCNGQDAFLIPTAEVPLTNMFRDSILQEDDLPISLVALTPCFRAEAGSYGRDTRGLIRTHQFHKVELVKITTPQTSKEQHEQLTKQAQKCLELLKLPYRKVRLSSGDIGFSAQHCYDLEVYLPGQKIYKEISSCSNCGDFQARRMLLRYRPQQDAKKKTRFCHTINGSALAVGRTLVAILENYQLPDGSVAIPEVLQPYMEGLTIIKASKY